MLWLSVCQLIGLATALIGGILLSSLAGASELAGCVGGSTVIVVVLGLRKTSTTTASIALPSSAVFLMPLAVLVVSC